MDDRVEKLRKNLCDAKYVADEGLAMVLYLAQLLNRPLLLEGPAGVGKTALAKAVSEVRGVELIRLQC